MGVKKSGQRRPGYCKERREAPSPLVIARKEILQLRSTIIFVSEVEI